MAKKRLRGVFSFTATPTRDDGATIDLDRLRPHLDWQIENGVHGIAILGSTGSNGSFTKKSVSWYGRRPAHQWPGSGNGRHRLADHR